MYKDFLFQVIDEALLAGVIDDNTYEKLDEKISSMTEFSALTLISESCDYEPGMLLEVSGAAAKKAAQRAIKAGWMKRVSKWYRSRPVVKGADKFWAKQGGRVTKYGTKAAQRTGQFISKHGGKVALGTAGGLGAAAYSANRTPRG